MQADISLPMQRNEHVKHAQRAAHLLASLREQGVIAHSVHSDSRQLTPGALFLAYPGERDDGRRHLSEAVRAGAVAVLWEAHSFDWSQTPVAVQGLPNIGVKDLRQLAGPVAAGLYEQTATQAGIEVDRAPDVIAVTGTNGKTSCAVWIAQALALAGRCCGLVGTLGIGHVPALAADAEGGAVPQISALQPNPNTTPEAVLWQRSLQDFRKQGMTAVAVEASSIGLDQGRLNGTRIAVALFTNLSRDHLDYHADMQQYAQAKRRLFGMLGLQAAVLNLNDAMGCALAAELAGEAASALRIIGYQLHDELAARSGHAGKSQDAVGAACWMQLHASDLRHTTSGMALQLQCIDATGQRRTLPMQSRMIGRHNVENILGVLGVLLAQGIDLQQAVRCIELLPPVPGRMQPVRATPLTAATASASQPMVIVDYAHTPDALQQALQALRAMAKARGGKLQVLFGCGGDRDQGKRALMGGVAAQLADAIMLTSDNPRSEAPQVILDDILHGVPPGYPALQIEVDRALAIQQMIAQAGVRDVLLLAGKGHETTQEVAGVRTPFSDLEQAQRALQQRCQSAQEPPA